MQAAGVPIVKPLYEDDTFASFRCADPTRIRSRCIGGRQLSTGFVGEFIRPRR
jgi:hypothetical protein